MSTVFKRSHRFTLLLLSSLLIIAALCCILFHPVRSVEWINGLHHPALDFIFAGITNLGDGLIIFLVTIVLLFNRFYLAIGLAVNGIVQGITVSIFKRLLFPKAPRPIQFLDADTVHFVQGISVHKWMSFPSGHTVTIFGLCVFLSLCYRNTITTTLMLFLASLVALSRVYLLQHFVIDITAGAFIGSLIGLLSFQLFESITKPKWMNQRLEIELKRFQFKSRSMGQ